MNKDHKQWLTLGVLFGSFVRYEGHTFGLIMHRLPVNLVFLYLRVLVRQLGKSAAINVLFQNASCFFFLLVVYCQVKYSVKLLGFREYTRNYY